MQTRYSLPVVILPALLLCSAAPAALATPIAYTLFFTDSTSGRVVGTGSFTITSAPSQTPGSVSTYDDYGYPTDSLTSFSFTVEGITYSTAKSPIDPTSVTFTGGQFTGAEYTGLMRNGNANIYGLTYDVSNLSNPVVGTGGTITAAPTVSPTPEPSALALMATGLLAIAYSARRASS